MIEFITGFVAALLIGSAALFFGLSYQGWIALDQYLSCRLNKYAWADETYSARMWRRRDVPQCARRVRQLDWLFERLGYGTDHCQLAYLRELNGKQNSPEYKK